MQISNIVERLQLHVQYIKFRRQKQDQVLAMSSDSKEVRKMVDTVNKILNTGTIKQFYNGFVCKSKFYLESSLFVYLLIGLKQYPNYWLLFSDIMEHRLTIRFVNQLEFLKTDGEKAFQWLLLEFTTKQLKNLFNMIRENPDFLQEYEQDSYVKQNFYEIIQCINTLHEVDYQINNNMADHYAQFEQLEIEKVDNDENSQLLSREQSGQSFANQQELIRQGSKYSLQQETPENPSISNEAKTTMKQEYQNFRESVVQKQDEEEKLNINSDEEEQNEIQSYQGSHSSSKNDGKLEKQVSKKTITQYPRMSSKIDFEKFLECKEARPSNVNILYRERYGNHLQSEMVPSYLKPSAVQGDGQNAGQHNFSLSHHKRNSAHLYEKEYETIYENFQFQHEPQKHYTLAEQNYECHLCKQKLSQGVYVMCNNAHFCNYNQAYICDQCLSREKRILPWKVLKNFDCKSYKISKQAKHDIDFLFDKCILRFEYDSDIVFKNKKLYDFMVLKRSLHLLYDMICNPYLVDDLLESNKNLLLKQNLFSLKNFYEINNGSLMVTCQRYYALLQNHVIGCNICSKKGFTCKICNEQDKLFNFDILNTSLCSDCTHIYHKKCLETNNCFNCMVNM